MSDQAEKIPPYSEEAERGVLGSILVDEKVLHLLRGRYQIDSEMLWTPAHRIILETMYEMADAAQAIDLLTLPARLKDSGMLDLAGGDEYLEKLVDQTPTSAHVEHYAEIVRRKFKARRFIDACRAGLDSAYHAEDIDAALSKTANKLHDLSQDQLVQARSNVQVFDELIARWEEAMRRRRSGDEVKLPGLETPFGRYNELLGGLQPGLHFVAAPPSAGKTSIEGQIAEHVAMHEGPVLRIYLDDTQDDAIARSASRIGGVSLPKLQHGFADRGDIEKIKSDVRPLMETLPIYIVEDVETVEQVCTLARLYKAKHGIKLLTVDYAQIVGTEVDDWGMQERDRLAHVCAKLKRLWKELRIPILLLSQVQRENYKQDSEPRKAAMADLFGGAVLEHTASSVLILKSLKDDDIAPQPIDQDKYSFKFAVAGHVVKNKHGPQGLVPLWFYRKYFRFENTRTKMVGNVREYMTWEEQLEIEKDAGL